jgi:predicted nucleic acid-binding protein
MKYALIDAGPLIALFNKNDKYHEKIKKFIMAYDGIQTFVQDQLADYLGNRDVLEMSIDFSIINDLLTGLVMNPNQAEAQ